MSVGTEKRRKTRVDSLRNREQLLEAAKAAFTEVGAQVPLEDIARRAGVGIATLYRHFPTRDALLAAVYRREVDQLCASADALLAEQAPGDALEAWLHLLVDYMATKRMIAPALRASSGAGARAFAASAPALTEAVRRLVRGAAEGGDIGPDIRAEDVGRALVGLSHGYDQAGWEPSARRLIGILMAGLRSRA